MKEEKFFPKGFADSLRKVMDNDTETLLEALKDIEHTPVSVRFNPYKIISPPEGTLVDWCRYGRYLDSRPRFTLDPGFHAGNYYVQEASSMFVEHLYREVAETTEIRRLLDLCASPGGKSTLYSTLVGLEGIVVANEPIRQRASILADNIRKWGLGNVVVTSNDPQHFAPLRDWFDVVAVDAPCSGEGMFRKSDEARRQWSADSVKMCASRQKRILSEAWKALRPGGILIYSTCTFNRQENEDNVAWMLEEFDCEAVDIHIPEKWGVVSSQVGEAECYRFYPHLVFGEGFFACVLRKCGQKGRHAGIKSRRTLFNEFPKSVSSELGRYVRQPDFMHFAAVGDNCYGYYEATYRDIKVVSETLTAIHSGVCMGLLFGKTLKPDHSLATFHDVSHGALNIVRLNLDEARGYLRRKDSFATGKLANGMNLVCYEASADALYPIGWAKKVTERVNNLYPKSLAIQNAHLLPPSGK